jgi:hypothetical protein
MTQKYTCICGQNHNIDPDKNVPSQIICWKCGRKGTLKLNVPVK